MPARKNSIGYALALASVALFPHLLGDAASAGKEKFVRTKPHMNVGTIGSGQSPSSTNTSGFQQSSQSNSSAIADEQQANIEKKLRLR